MVLIELPPSCRAINVASAEMRNREEDRDSGAHAAEENQNHERGQEQADAAFMQQRLQSRF